MPIALTGPISFSDIQNEFGGTNPIGLDEYYQDSGSNYTKSVSGIPNIGGSLSLSQFRGKKPYSQDYIYTTPGTYTFTVPQGCSNICVLCVGGGCDGSIAHTNGIGQGGGGGALAYVNNIAVNPGSIFRIDVGNRLSYNNYNGNYSGFSKSDGCFSQS